MTALRTDPTASDPMLDAGELLCAADHPARQVEWLWPGRIPIGKVTMLVGDPGEGKSLVSLDVAARISRGAAWPDQDDTANAANPGSVLVLSTEDDLHDTIRPRLDAAGADASRVFFLPSVVDLRNDLAKLRAAIERMPDCRLIIIDPVSAYVGPGDSHFQTVVRRVLEPLAQLAAEKRLAVLAISHLRKSEGTAIQRAAGSMGFVSTARSVWTVCRDPDQPGRRLLLPLKNNLVADTTGLAYTITSQPADEHCPAIAWHATDVTTSAAEALGPVQKSRGPEAAELRDAAAWLRDQLADGPQDAFTTTMSGSMAGFSERTLRRALHSMGGRTVKGSWAGAWRWSLPSAEGDSPTPTAPPENLASSEETCPLGENSQPEPNPERTPTNDARPKSARTPPAPARDSAVTGKRCPTRSPDRLPARRHPRAPRPETADTNYENGARATLFRMLRKEILARRALEKSRPERVTRVPATEEASKVERSQTQS